MKKTLRKVHHRATMNLGDLIALVSGLSRNSRETIAAVADLIDSGRVRFRSQGRKLRAHVC
jgi:hypothetical protein